MPKDGMFEDNLDSMKKIHPNTTIP